VQFLELLLAFAAGGFLTWLVVRQQEGRKVAEATAAAAARAAAAEARLEAANDRQTLLDRAEQQLRDVFRSTAAEALQANTESVVTLATSTLEKFHERATGDLKQREQSISEMVRPIAETLKAVDARMIDVEKDRASTSATLAEQLRADFFEPAAGERFVLRLGDLFQLKRRGRHRLHGAVMKVAGKPRALLGQGGLLHSGPHLRLLDAAADTRCDDLDE